MKKITSHNNQAIKDIVKLRKARERKKQGLIVIEGRHEIFLAENSGLTIDQLYCCQDFSSDENFQIKCDHIVELEKEVFQKISLRENPDGYIALAKPRLLELGEIELRKNPLILVLQSLEKPGNIGAILRTADAVNVDAVVICESKTDIYNHNVIRASLGTVFTNTIVTCSSDAVLEWLKSKNIKTFATAPKGKKLYFEVDYSYGSAIFIGAEHEGLSDKLLKRVDTTIKIPMLGKIDSLNASVSTAIVLYEAKKQRNFQS